MSKKEAYQRIESVVKHGQFDELADMLREAEQSHASYEATAGRKPLMDWPTYYARWLLGDIVT